MLKAQAAYESGDVSFYWSKSTDGGVSCPFLEKGTKAILSHDAVVAELESYCQRWTSGMFDIFQVSTKRFRKTLKI